MVDTWLITQMCAQEDAVTWVHFGKGRVNTSTEDSRANSFTHVPESRETLGTGTHRVGFNPTVNLKTTIPTSQSNSEGLVQPPIAKLSLCCLQVPPFHQQTTFFNIWAQPKWEWPVTDPVTLKPGARRSCSACFLFKVLFYFIFKWSGTQSVAFYTL